MSGILAVYALLERDLPARECAQSGRCCQFRVTGREPFVTRAELDLVVAELRKQGRRVPPPRDDGGCPLWSEVTRLCTVHAARPMGCRTFFCREAGGAVAASKVRDALHALNALEEGRGSGREGGRPLTRALQSAR